MLAIDNLAICTCTYIATSILIYCHVFFQLQACNMEAQILTTLINNRSPVIVSDPYLTHLVGAELQMADSHSTVPTSTTSTPAPTSNGSGCACASCFMLCVTLTITMLIRQFLTGNLLIDTKKRIY